MFVLAQLLFQNLDKYLYKNIAYGEYLGIGDAC